VEKLYKALIWLAGVALALGLVITFLYTAMAMNNLPNGYALGHPDGPIAVFFTTLSTQKLSIVADLSGVLGDGAIALAAALAWMEGRRGWLTALIGVRAALLLQYTADMTWNYLLNLNAASGSMNSGAVNVGEFNFVNFAVPLIPVALALIFALAHRKAAAIETNVTEAKATESDGTLEIIRSPL
jgi:hypothetical protein